MSEKEVVRYRQIDVWDIVEGDVVKTVYDATDRDLEELEQQYDEGWQYDVKAEPI